MTSIVKIRYGNDWNDAELLVSRLDAAESALSSQQALARALYERERELISDVKDAEDALRLARLEIAAFRTKADNLAMENVRLCGMIPIAEEPGTADKLAAVNATLKDVLKQNDNLRTENERLREKQVEGLGRVKSVDVHQEQHNDMRCEVVGTTGCVNFRIDPDLGNILARHLSPRRFMERGYMGTAKQTIVSRPHGTSLVEITVQDRDYRSVSFQMEPRLALDTAQTIREHVGSIPGSGESKVQAERKALLKMPCRDEWFLRRIQERIDKNAPAGEEWP